MPPEVLAIAHKHNTLGWAVISSIHIELHYPTGDLATAAQTELEAAGFEVLQGGSSTHSNTAHRVFVREVKELTPNLF